MSRVLVIGDTHCPGMREDYPAFLRDIAKDWRCDRVVHVGDMVDWASISYHEKDPGLSSAEDEYWKAMAQVKELHKLFPDVDWLIGNHDALTQRQATTAGLPKSVLKDYGEMWEVPDWRIHQRFATLTIDGVTYSHGETGKGGMYCAVKQSRDNFCNWVCGHWHSEAGVWFTVNADNRIFGMNVGTGIDAKLLQFDYGRKFTKKPVNGCGVVIDGRYAYFEPMILGEG